MMNMIVRAHFSRGDMASALRVLDDGYALAERISFRFLMAQFCINQDYGYGSQRQDDKAQKALLAVLPITRGAPGTGGDCSRTAPLGRGHACDPLKLFGGSIVAGRCGAFEVSHGISFIRVFG